MKFLTFIVLTSIFVSCASKNEVSQKEKNAKKADIYYGQGSNELLRGEYTQALKHLIQANTLKQDDANILNNLGMAYYFKGKTGRAIRYIKRSLELDKKNTKARLNLATIYTGLKKYEDARQQYEVVLEDLTYEAQYKTYYNLGLLYYNLNQKSKALSYFKQSLNEKKDFCGSHFYIGQINYEQGHFKKALKSYLSSGYGMCYNNPKPIYHQALSYIKLKQYDNARLKLEEILDRFKNTDFQQKAEKQIQTLNSLQQQEIYPEIDTRNILSPSF